MVLSMERWFGKVAVITGAGSGIGAAAAKRLVEEGLIIDVTKEESILRAFKWVKENVGPVSILVNNAGVFFPRPLISGKTNEWRLSLEVNVVGVCAVTREAVKIMREHDIDGHIINLNNLSGHRVMPNTGIYASTKYAVTALTETLRLELNSLKSRIKVTNLSPGVVETPPKRSALRNDGFHRHAEFKLKAEDVADAIVYVLSTPPNMQ
ncbi:hypothetical protein NQ318_012489, partial [Aromia moschata]